MQANKKMKLEKLTYNGYTQLKKNYWFSHFSMPSLQKLRFRHGPIGILNQNFHHKLEATYKYLKWFE